MKAEIAAQLRSANGVHALEPDQIRIRARSVPQSAAHRAGAVERDRIVRSLGQSGLECL